MNCGACGTENDADRKFCMECGAALALACPACGAANPPTSKFCGECGTALATAGSLATDPGPATATAPTTERRLVSVFFADLVGFTTLSESRDPEAMRELMDRYFERDPRDRSAGTAGSSRSSSATR